MRPDGPLRPPHLVRRDAALSPELAHHPWYQDCARCWYRCWGLSSLRHRMRHLLLNGRASPLCPRPISGTSLRGTLKPSGTPQVFKMTSVTASATVGPIVPQTAVPLDCIACCGAGSSMRCMTLPQSQMRAVHSSATTEGQGEERWVPYGVGNTSTSPLWLACVSPRYHITIPRAARWRRKSCLFDKVSGRLECLSSGGKLNILLLPIPPAGRPQAPD